MKKKLRFLLGSCALAATVIPAFAQNIERPIFSEPPSVRSSGGVLDLLLEVKLDTFDIAGKKIIARSYNGSIPGPTLRIVPGDTIKLRLKNSLPPNPDENDDNLQNYFQRINSTNIHTHGGFVSPKGNSDNPFLEVNPGEEFSYAIPYPADHEEGMDWYHPHHHMALYAQIAGGMFGALFIEGGLDTLPEVRAAQQKTMIFHYMLYDSTINQFPYPNKPNGTFGIFPNIASSPLLVNGLEQPVLTMQPGEVQRWRMLNATDDHTLTFSFRKENNEQKISYQLLAYDGVTLTSPEMRDTLGMAIGNRAELMLKAPSEPGEYILYADQVVEAGGTLTQNIPVLRVVVQGEPLSMNFVSSATPHSKYLQDISPDEVTGYRNITFEVKGQNIAAMAQNPALITDVFSIDGMAFDHERAHIQVREGDVEEWTIINKNRARHPFHIHVNPFQVVRKNGVDVEDPIWQDVILLDSGETTIRTRFLRFDGKTVFHCHIPFHEDLGMMQAIEILPRGVSVDQPWDESKREYASPFIGPIEELRIPIPAVLDGKLVRFELFSINGQQLINEEFNGTAGTEHAIRVAHLRNGSYFYRISSGKFLMTNKMIITR